MATLLDLRYIIEKQVKDNIENQEMVNWANEVNADIGTNINIPADPVSITLTPTELEYTLPDDLKVINRLRLQSWIDQNLDIEFTTPYRIYNGKIILPRILWIAPDELVVDYYKHLSYFETESDVIDIPDRLSTVYTFYGFWKYYNMPEVLVKMGEAQARKMAELYLPMYNNMRNQVISYYSLSDEPTTVEGMWGR